MHTLYTRLLILLVLLAPLSVRAAGDLAPGGGAIGSLPSPYGNEGDCLLITGGIPSWGACPGAGTGAPADAKYITQTANGTLSAEQALSSLATGIMKVTTTTGVVSVAVAGTDYPGLAFANVFTKAQAIQPDSDAISLAIRRNGAAQTAKILEIQTELNATLASIDKTGAITAPSFTGNVTGAVTGNASTATALAADPADCAANNFATTINASGTLTCAQPSISAGVSGLGTGVATFLGTPSSANLRSALTDETGSGGAAVFATAPTIDSPTITTKMNPPSVTAFPGSPSTGDVVIVTDDSAAGACDSAAGSAVSICRYTGSAWAAIGDGNSGSGAPTNATYITQTANGSLSNEQALGSLATGILKNTTTTGVLSIASAGTDYVAGTPGTTANAIPRASGTGGTTLKASGCTINDSDMLTCAGGFTAGTSGVGVVTLLEGTAPGAGTNAGEHNLYFDSTGSLLKSHENGGSVVTYYSTANAPTSVSGNAGTATALAANPADCSANNFATTIAANGDLTCAQPSISAGVSGLGTGVATFLGTPSSANLATALTDETGSGAAVFGTAPTISSAVLSTKVNLPRVTAFPGTPSAGDTVIVTDDSTAGACDSAAGSATSLCQYSGSAWVKLGDGTSAGGALSSTDIDTSAELAAIVGDETGSGALVFGTSPTLTTPTIGVATATSINKMAITAPATSSTLAVANSKTFTANNTLTLAGTDSTTITFQATDTYVGRATTDTLTNKTIDCEGTGNSCGIPKRLWFPAAGCNNATAGSVWDLPTSNPAVAACKTGTNTQMGVLDFADGSNLSAQVTYMLPTTWTGTIDARIKWLTSATTGDVVWQLSTICVADAETDDPAFNTASTVTDTAKGTTLQTNDAAITTVTVTGCAAGELMHLKIQRDSGHASDTLAATARLIGVELAVREAL